MFGGGKRPVPAAPGTELRIGPSDAVDGTVRAGQVVVAGTMRGALSAGTSVRIEQGGRCEGQIHAPRLSVARGASVRAACRIGVPVEEPQPLEEARA
jgi:cytoskeletal protein CcmA (bactofilin family)